METDDSVPLQVAPVLACFNSFSPHSSPGGFAPGHSLPVELNLGRSAPSTISTNHDQHQPRSAPTTISIPAEVPCTHLSSLSSAWTRKPRSYSRRRRGSQSDGQAARLRRCPCEVRWDRRAGMSSPTVQTGRGPWARLELDRHSLFWKRSGLLLLACSATRPRAPRAQRHG